jgi:hypothetical protein
LSYNGNLPSGIVASGAVGLAGLSPDQGASNQIVDVYVSKFTFVPSSINPD